MNIGLRPLHVWYTNGVLKGSIGAFDADGEPLWEDTGNWTSRAFRDKAALGLAEATGMTPERARSLILAAVREARKAAGNGDGQADGEPRVEIKARLPGLVDIVVTVDGEPAYLFLDGGALVTRKEHVADGVRHLPPAREHFPYLIPREAQVRAAFADDTDEKLFADLIAWHRSASVLGEDRRYTLVTLFDFHTYLAEFAAYSPWLVFQSVDSERGKSRQGSAIAHVAYRGISTETLQEANLFRWSDSLGATVFIDVRNLWVKAEKRGSDDIILARFQRDGPKVARVLDPQAGPFKGVTYFDCYGPTVAAVNEPLRDPLLSRSLVIVPPEATGRYRDVRPQDGLPLRERLVAFRARTMGVTLPEVPKPVDGRLGDILQPLAQIATFLGGEAADEFPAIAAAFRQEKLEERAETAEARLVKAFRRVIDGDTKITDGKVPVAAVTAAYNEGVPERQQVREETVGRRLSSLGFKAARLPGGARARLLDQELLDSLSRKFGVDE